MPTPPPARHLTQALFGTCSSGLGNRLLMLAGARRVAARTGRRFFLYWPVNDNVGCPFGDLFASELPVLAEEDLHRLLLTYTKVKVYNAGLGPRGESYEAVAPDGDPHIDLVVLKCWHYPKFDGEPEDDSFFAGLRAELAALRLLPELEAAVAAVPLPEPMIGVHIRRGDDPERFGRSQDGHFQALMTALLERRPDVRFFLATNCAETEARFRDAFGDRIVTQPKQLPARATASGMREAVVDLGLLARTSAILGNCGSSFSRVAALLGGRPLLLASDETAVTRREENVQLLLRALDGETAVAGLLRS